MRPHPHEFKVTLFVYEDGTFAAQGDDLRGLVLETESFDEMRKELLRLTPRLLRANHGLSDDEIKDVRINVSTCYVRDDKRKQPRRRSRRVPRLMWEDIPPFRAVA